MIPLAALSLLRRFWPVLVGAVALAAMWLWGNSREHDGVMIERATWQAAARELRDLKQRAADKATTGRDAGQAKVATAKERVIERTNTYYVDRPVDAAAVCLPADRVRAVEASRGEIAAADRGSGGAPDEGADAP